MRVWRRTYCYLKRSCGRLQRRRGLRAWFGTRWEGVRLRGCACYVLVMGEWCSEQDAVVTFACLWLVTAGHFDKGREMVVDRYLNFCIVAPRNPSAMTSSLVVEP